MIRNIIWDADGTLFDTYPAIASSFQAAMADLGVEVPLDWITSLAKKSVGMCETSLAEQYQVSEELLDQKFDVHYGRIRYEDQPAFPGVAAICEYIHSIGGKNVIVTHRGRSGIVGLLAASRLSGWFAGTLTNDDGYPRKPDPAAFEAALREYGLERAETIAVGDRDIDVQAGQAAGLFTCLFGADADGCAPELTVSSYDQLYRYIQSANSAR